MVLVWLDDYKACHALSLQGCWGGESNFEIDIKDIEFDEVEAYVRVYLYIRIFKVCIIDQYRTKSRHTCLCTCQCHIFDNTHNLQRL